MNFRIICPCGASARVEVRQCPDWLSPIALAMNAAVKKGFRYDNAPLGKSTITMTCAKCRGPVLRLEADEDIGQGTTQFDPHAEEKRPQDR